MAPAPFDITARLLRFDCLRRRLPGVRAFGHRRRRGATSWRWSAAARPTKEAVARAWSHAGGQGGPVSEANPKGYNFQVHVTSGHEAEAKAAELAKKPNRFGMLILRLL